MQLRHSSTGFEACKTSIDVVYGLDEFDVFQVSEQVVSRLQQNSKSDNFLNKDYWRLVINKVSNSSLLEWEITVDDALCQIPLNGKVEFRHGLPTLV